MQFTVIASGSRGNAAVLEMDGAALLFDCGISYSRLVSALHEINLSPDELDAVFLTHEHTDHASGLKTLMNKHRLPFFTRLKTFDALPSRLKPDDADFRPLFDKVTIGSLMVESFATSHDAADSVGYSVISSAANEKFSLATDLGVMTNTVMSQIADADVLLLEANHDREMLRRGSYPWPLKQRILSPKGHLDNRSAGEALVRLVRRPKRVVIGHMSEENNRPLVARQTIEEILASAGIVPAAFPLTVLGQGEGTRVDT